MRRFLSSLLFTLATGSIALGQGAAKQKEQPRLIAALGHYGGVSGVNGIAISADGKWLFTAGDDKTARMWEVATGREIRTFIGHTDYVTCLALSSDGKWLATGSWDDTARIWDVATGKQIRVLRETFERKQDTDKERYSGPLVRAVSFSADAKWLATASAEAVRVWNTDTGKEAHTFPRRDQWNFDAVALSPDGKWLVAGAKNGYVWDLTNGQLKHTVKAEPGGVHAAAVSRDGKFFALGNGREAHLWELHTGKFVRAFKGHEYLLSSVAFSPDGKRLATGSAHENAKLWEISTGAELRAFEAKKFSVQAVAFSADGKSLAAGGAFNFARLWDAETGKQLQAFERNTKHVEVHGLYLSGNGKRLALRIGYSDTHVWDLPTGKPIRVLKDVGALALSEDGELLATNTDPAVKILDLKTGKYTHSFPHKIGANAAVFSSDGKWLITASGNRGSHGVRLVVDDNVRLWDLKTGKLVRGFPHETPAESLAISADNRFLVIGSFREDAMLWDANTGKKIRTFSGASEPVSSHALSGDGKWFVSTDWKGALLWNVNTGKIGRTLKTPLDRAESAILSRDGKWLVIAGRTGISTSAAYALRLEKGGQSHLIEGVYGLGTTLAISPDSRILFTHQQDGAVRVTELATGKELCRVAVFADGDWAVFDVDGRFDASNNGNTKNLHWAVGNDLFPLAQFHDRFYDPGLLAKHLGLHAQPPRKVDGSQ